MDFNLPIKLCFWNINGVRNKFLSEYSSKLFEQCEILVVVETHFNVRSKCPDNFSLIGRSKPVASKSPRGGVALYKCNSSTLMIDVVCDSLPDTLIFEIRNSTIAFIACYIPPSNSNYYNESYYNNLFMACDSFLLKKDIFILGDLNSRVGNSFPPKGHSYAPNPDRDINQNGRKLIRLLNDFKPLILINGLLHDGRSMDSALTFFRGRSSSQNDVAITNNIRLIHSFKVMDKLPLSDHCSCMLTFERAISPDINFINDCAIGFLNYDHYDVNRKIKPAINIRNLNITKLNNELTALGVGIKEEFQHVERSEDSINNLCATLTEGLYECCRKSKEKQDCLRVPTQQNCTSKHYKAISDANYMSYILHLNNNDSDQSEFYRSEWLFYQDVAWKKEKEELKQLKTHQWRNCYTNDSKKLWRMIDWKGEYSNTVKNDAIPPNVIYKYFNNIFNSEKTMNDPTICDIENIDELISSCPITDSQIDKEELDFAIKKLGNGISFDGISSDLLILLPEELRECILKLFQNIYIGHYPSRWNMQLLKYVTKKGHSMKNPKLRGIGIGEILGRLYDIVIDERFKSWFKPNPEQAGFRKLQGCILQLFALFLLLDWARYKGYVLFIGLLDYEKAFDFVNRHRLINDLVEEGADRNLVKNIYNMYKETSYVPKIDKTSAGDEIRTMYGVTQGKTSSCDIFSFYTSDMPRCFEDREQNDIDVNLLQLADDTVTPALSLNGLADNFQRIFHYSNDNFSKINYDKTQYMHMNESASGEPLQVNLDTLIEAVDPSDGYPWLGFVLSHADNIPDLVFFNFNKKKLNIAKFYSWLQINRDTPFMLKMRVLYGCMFAAILYSCEAWGDISHIADDLLAIERKALKSCLGVKQSTPNNLIYAELNSPYISSAIKDRQYTFLQKFLSLEEQDAIARKIWNDYSNDHSVDKPKPFLDYYNNLKDENRKQCISNIHRNILSSEKTMDIRYRSLFGFQYNSTLYSSIVNEDHRVLVSRWRLSCHKLHIETGRYKTPKLPREQRLCKQCGTVEDEHHALFVCTAHYNIRLKFKDRIKWTSVADLLNPSTEDELNVVGEYLKEIEKNMEVLEMCQ